MLRDPWPLTFTGHVRSDPVAFLAAAGGALTALPVVAELTGVGQRGSHGEAVLR